MYRQVLLLSSADRMSSKKLFEADISKSLTTFVPYFYKPPDGITNSNKVDFLVCYRSRFIAIEAKEVEGPTYNPTTDLTPGQLMTLRDVTGGGGLGILAVNFYRLRKTGSPRGRCGLWVIHPDTKINRFRYEEWEEEAVIGPEGTWELRSALDRLLSVYLYVPVRADSMGRGRSPSTREE